MPMGDSELATEWIDHDPQGQDAWVKMAQLRLGSGIIVALMILFVPLFGPDRFAVVMITGSIAMLGNLALLVHARRGGVIGLPVAVLDTLTTVIFVALVPNAFIAGLMILLGCAAMWVFWVGLRPTVAMLVVSSVSFLSIALVHGDISSWQISLATFVVGAAILVSTVSNISTANKRANDRYDAMVNGINAVVWEANGLVGDPEFFNSQTELVLGLSSDDCRSSGFLSSRIHPDDIDAFVRSRRDAAKAKNSDVQYRIRDRNGNTRYLHERITISENSDGRYSRRGVIVDETARSIAEASVKGYDDFIAGAPTAMAILRLDDLDNPQSLRIMSGNPAAAAVLGTTVEATIGRRFCDLVPDIPVFTERLANVAVLNTSLEAPAIRVNRSDSIYSLRAIPLPDQCIGLTLDDVTKAARNAETLKHQALHDHLTGLPNRAYFNERLERALKARRATDGACDVAVLMIDLNKFKDVNDNLGHEYGDKLLVELSKRLGRHIRGCDTIARLGGDEFAILVHAPDPTQVAREVADRVEQLVTEPFEIDRFTLNVGASIGVAGCGGGGSTAREILRDADNAMYKAKSFGGGTVVHGDNVGVVDSQVSIASEMQSAFDSDEFELRYQPRIDLRTMTAVGFEALVRWRHPRLGVLDPESFIEIAEASGMSDRLTRTVIDKALADLACLSIDDPGAGSLVVSVNVAHTNLTGEMFTEMIQQMTHQRGLAPSNLRLDIPEVQLQHELRDTLSTLHSLKQSGVQLTLDRFGLGTSTIRLLGDLPIDEIKVDKSLVATLGGGDETLIRAMIRLGHEFGYTVAANGVESADFIERLRLYGCDTAQGFYFAEPLNFNELGTFIRTFNATPRSERQTSDY